MVEFLFLNNLIEIYWLGFTGALFDLRFQPLKYQMTISFQLFKAHFGINIKYKIAVLNRRKK